MERLQKISAAAGIASRRKAEGLITAGRVAVNGKVISQLGAKADPARDHIRVDGKLLSAPQRKIYIVLNKPKGYVTTVSDPEGRPTVMDLIRGVGNERIYPVGRLDWNTEGLLLLTNDGELAARLMNARSHVAKTYMVKVSGKPSETELAKLRAGVRIGGSNAGRKMPPMQTAPAKIKPAPSQNRDHNHKQDVPNPWYEVTLIQGRNRQIHRMFEHIGHDVEKIKRVSYGPLELDVPLGEFRRLTAAEVAALRRASNAPAHGPSRRGERDDTRRRLGAVIKREGDERF
jgi:23S rRNA pseudouridine2605 synthase